MFKKILTTFALTILSLVTAHSQQYQTNNLPPFTPLYSTNAKYLNGTSIGFAPTGGSTGLTLNISSGTSFMSGPGAPQLYAGGTVSLTNNTTNYVYLNSSGTPTVSTSVFTTGQFPVAVVVTSSGNITSITDVRTIFSPGSGGSSSVTWPANGDVVISNTTNSPTGIPAQLNLCLGGTTGPVWGNISCVSSLTTTGTSGASTFNTTTGVLNIPVYSSGSSGVSEIIPGTNTTCSPEVSGSCTGNVTVNATSAGSSPVAPNSLFVWTGTSGIDDDGGLLAPNITVSAFTCNGTTCTVNTSTPHGFTTGQWINMRHVTGWFSPPSGFSLGTGYTLFQVISTGLTSTQFEFNYSLNSGTPSTGGYVESAMNNLPFRTAQEQGMPSNAVANTYVYLPTTPSIENEAANFSTLFANVPTGLPTYLIPVDSNNDVSLCRTASQIETDFQTLMAHTHLADWYFVAVSAGAVNINQQTTGCSPPAYSTYLPVQVWLPTQGPTTENLSSKEYWDIFSDAGSVYNDAFSSNLGGSFPGGWNLKAQKISTDLLSGAGAPLPKMPLYFAGYPSNQNNSVNGYTWWAQGDTNTTFLWLASNFTPTFWIDTFDDNIDSFTLCLGGDYNSNTSKNVYGCPNDSASTLAGYTNIFQAVTIDGVAKTSFKRAGLLCWDGGGSIQNCPTWMGQSGVNAPLELNGSTFQPDSGITAQSGGSNDNVWNTNGGVEALPSIRAGTWSISSATSVAITFATSMAATPDSCSVTPSASAATTGTPFATSLSSTGFTVNVPTSGTISGTYQCVKNNAY